MDKKQKPQAVKRKFLVFSVRKYGGSLYVPLTKFLRKISLDENDNVMASLDEGTKRITIEKYKEKMAEEQ